jgi:FMN phosphatase YigB (HAD superfamily)
MPHPKVYQLAVDRLGIPAAAIAFQSSNAWDAYAASAFGMRVVWCNRYGQRSERLPGGAGPHSDRSPSFRVWSARPKGALRK